MFVLHLSNRTENLLQHLQQVFDVAPLSTPFAKEVLMIQSRGMERWLAQQLAARFKVWANYEFLFPAAFFNAIAERIDTRLNAEAFERNRLLWRLEALLRNADAGVYRPLKHYLAGDNVPLKRYQLARQLAQLLDQYQVLRPDMLEAWKNRPVPPAAAGEEWQRALWLGLTAQVGTKHRGELWLETIDKLNAAKEGAFAERLPERISLFGLSTMPPLFLGFLQGVARHTQVHLFLLNPARHYWADVESKRQTARKNLLSLAIPQPLAGGHPLLAALGQQGREFQQLLLEHVEFSLELESYEQHEAPNNLQQLQNDLLDNRVSSVKPRYDGSIAIHACHSRMREVEVLRDQLLHALESDPNLELRDVVVMAPDIQQYASLIAAVFADIQHAIADRSLRVGNALLDALLGFLRLAQGRCGWQEVLDLLHRPEVRAGFDLSETDMQWVSHWVEETRIRWGRSAEHKQQLGLPPLPENTWLAGLQRMLMGYALGDDSEFVFGILPYKHLEGSSAQALGGLYDYLQLLFAAAEDLPRVRTLHEWGEALLRYAAQLFAAPPGDSVEHRQLQELIGELLNDLGTIHHQPVAIEVLIAWLEDTLDERLAASGFLRGQLTFCSMLPMRAIPFKVIALLGLNEGEFPRIDRAPAFDLIAKHFRPGDRSRRADDRYQFLEILLSARRQLIITYIGQSIRDNRPIPPSVVVDELLEVLDEAYGLDDLVVNHPLQPFSARYFHGDGPFSYADGHCATAEALARPAAVPQPWWGGEVAAVDNSGDAAIEFTDLLAFYRHPQKYFLQRHLALYLQGLTVAAEEREPFAVTGLDAYAMQQQWLAVNLSGKPVELDKWRAQGLWPAGALGELERQRFEPALEKFAAVVAAKAVGAALPDRLFDLQISRYRLVGKLTDLYENGRLICRYGNFKGKDLLYAWLQHLVGNCLHAQPTYLLGKDEDLLLPAELGNPEMLAGLLELYQLGQTRPDVFYTEAALAYLRREQALLNGGKSGKTALEAAEESLLNMLASGYDADLELVLRYRDPATSLLKEEFEQACRILLLPMWLAIH